PEVGELAEIGAARRVDCPAHPADHLVGYSSGVAERYHFGNRYRRARADRGTGSLQHGAEDRAREPQAAPPVCLAGGVAVHRLLLYTRLAIVPVMLLSRDARVAILWASVAAIALAAALMPPFAQPESYHAFADRRTLLGIANALDVT